MNLQVQQLDSLNTAATVALPPRGDRARTRGCKSRRKATHGATRRLCSLVQDSHIQCPLHTHRSISGRPEMGVMDEPLEEEERFLAVGSAVGEE